MVKWTAGLQDQTKALNAITVYRTTGPLDHMIAQDSISALKTNKTTINQIQNSPVI